GPYPGPTTGRQDRHLVAGTDPTRGDAAGEPAEILVWPDHVLHGEAEFGTDEAARDFDRLEVLQQGRPAVPGHRLPALHHVVALERTHRDEDGLRLPEAADERPVLVGDASEGGLVIVDEVHLVDGNDQVGDP